MTSKLFIDLDPNKTAWEYGLTEAEFRERLKRQKEYDTIIKATARKPNDHQ